MSFPRLISLALLLAASALRADPVALPAAPEAPLDRAALIERLASDLANHYALTDRLDVDLLRPWIAPAGAPGDARVDVVVAEYPEALAPSLLLRVRYVRAERILREDTLSLRVNLWRDGLVSAGPVARGDGVLPEAVEIRRIDALRDREALPATMLGQDYVFARAIPAGRPLTWRDVSRRALVHRGQTVEVSASDGALLITIKALAMQDGAQGESVRVRNTESKREFTALVVAENRAEVRF